MEELKILLDIHNDQENEIRRFFARRQMFVATTTVLLSIVIFLAAGALVSDPGELLPSTVYKMRAVCGGVMVSAVMAIVGMQILALAYSSRQKFWGYRIAFAGYVLAAASILGPILLL